MKLFIKTVQNCCVARSHHTGVTLTIEMMVWARLKRRLLGACKIVTDSNVALVLIIFTKRIKLNTNS